MSGTRAGSTRAVGLLHTLTVTHRLRTDDEDLQCIAVGHDLIENTETTAEELRALGFTDRVARGILTLTKRSDLSEADYRTGVMSNSDAVRVKIGDSRHNSDIRRLKGVNDKDIARMVRYHEFYLRLKALGLLALLQPLYRRATT